MQRDLMNPFFDEAAMVEIGKRMVERWQKFQPLWILGGDGDYRGRQFADLWRRVGRGIFAAHPEMFPTGPQNGRLRGRLDG